jgi:hypothetical protein
MRGNPWRSYRVNELLLDLRRLVDGRTASSKFMNSTAIDERPLKQFVSAAASVCWDEPCAAGNSRVVAKIQPAKRLSHVTAVVVSDEWLLHELRMRQVDPEITRPPGFGRDS